jgi:hypothetical protein
MTMGWNAEIEYLVGFAATAVLLMVISIAVILAKSLFVVALITASLVGCAVLAPFVGAWVYVLFRKIVD